MHLELALLICTVACAVACDAGDEGEGSSTDGDADFRAIVSAYAWNRVEATDQDPFAAERPAEATCDESGIAVEQGTDELQLEIDTELCNYASVRQPALTSVGAGGTLRVRIWHDDLTSDDLDAVGYVGVAIAGERVYEVTVPIPADGALLLADLPLSQNLEVGTDVVVHVNNHGENTWAVVELSVSDP